MDQAVLEALFPEELRDQGITVAAMGGHSRATALLDAALLNIRGTSGRMA